MATCDNMDESPIHFAKWKNPDSKNYILYDFIYMTFFQRQTLRIDNRSIVARVWSKVEGLTTKRHEKYF